MKKLILILTLAMTASLFAFDPKGDVARVNDNGEVIQSTKRRGVPDKFVYEGKKFDNYKKFKNWEAHDWVNVEAAPVVVTNIIDRAEMVVDELSGNTNAVPADPVFFQEVSIIQRALPVLESIAPERSGLETLQLMRDNPTSMFVGMAHNRYKDKKSKGKTEEQIDMLKDVSLVYSLLFEVMGGGIDWRSETFGQQFTTNIVEGVQWIEKN